MSILGAGLLGNSRNGIGNIVTYVAKGRTIARTKPATYNDAKSVMQVLQRDRMTVLMTYARLLLGVIRTSFQTKKAFLSGINAFIQANLKPENFVSGGKAFILSNMIIAKGLLQKIKIEKATLAVASGTLSVTYNVEANGTTGFENDLVFYAVIDKSKNVAYSGQTTQKRRMGSFALSIPGLIGSKNTDLAVYVYGKSDPTMKLNDVSDSDYSLVTLIF